jgi:cell division transport system permease protein
MRINNIGCLLKEGIRGIFLHGFMSFAAVCVTLACLLIMGMFASVMYNINILVNELNQTNEVIVYIDETLTDSEARSIETQIRPMDNVLSANFVTREQALKDFVAEHEGDSAFSGVDAKTLRHRVVVVLEDNALMEKSIEEFKQIKGVADISAAHKLAAGFATIQHILQVVFVAVLVVLLVVSLLIISNTIRIGMYDRRDEIAIMRMVGATNGFIRLPFIVEGFILGMVGAGGAFALVRYLYNFMVDGLKASDALQMLSFVPFAELRGAMIALCAGAGLFVGMVGSWSSIRRFLKV